jgi:dihydrofolate reductase
MRRIRYSVAASLDGYIATPEGGYDWIPADPEIDFAQLFARYDTVLMGRRSYEVVLAESGAGMEHMERWVFSRTLRPQEHPDVRIVASGIDDELRALRSRPGKNIWLFGGGDLFRTLLTLGQVDEVEVAILPVLLGGGVPLLPSPADRALLTLAGHRVYPMSGTVLLAYSVRRSNGNEGTAR